MNANICPNCSQPLVTFPEFVRKVEPLTIATCRACGKQARRSRAVWILLIVAGVLFGALAIALTRTDWQPLAILAVMVVALPLWFLAVKFIAWSVVPWKTV